MELREIKKEVRKICKNLDLPKTDILENYKYDNCYYVYKSQISVSIGGISFVFGKNDVWKGVFGIIANNHSECHFYDANEVLMTFKDYLEKKISSDEISKKYLS